ncbi:MAG: hypothetical protein ABIH38_04295 [Patescibacteria group bacterium]
MKKTLFLALSLVMAAGLLLTGCGEKKVAENILEKATNGAADVDVSGDTITVNTNAGSWTAGDSVSLPSGFPSDVYVIDGTVKVATTIKENESYMVSLETTKSVAEAKAAYERELAADGWTININMTISESVSLGGEKDNRTVSVIIAKTDDSKTQVSISTAVIDEAFTNTGY